MKILSPYMQTRGFSLIELLVGASILSLFIVSLVVVFQNFLVQSFNSVERVQASFLTEEGIEAMKAIRDGDWDQDVAMLTSGDSYFLVFEEGLWHATTTSQDFIHGLFERTVTVEDVYRDGSDDIADSGSLDPNTKKVTVFVSWLEGSATTTQSIATYITNFHE